MDGLKSIISTLQETAAVVRELEEQAHQALYQHCRKERYRELLIRKAKVLADLVTVISPHLSVIDPATSSMVQHQVGAFSFSAHKALKLDSIFYMSALLYPEDYVDGDKNDLESFISTLELAVK